jgi:holo-[acyl-carrier protein] synthase
VNHIALAQLLDDATALSSDHLSLTVGIDRVEIEAFDQLLVSSGDDFLAEVYTADELAYCAGRIKHLAARFCAKEATLKALGTGIRGVALAEVEVIHAANGQPDIALLGRASDRAAALHIVSLAVSMTHTKFAAEAVVIALLDTRKDARNVERRTIDG